ncbi:interleukin-7 receptor subunit alpha isoform X2 [Hippoglossus hippoglossus]|uniref:interleukin-7 receptor subunit alpha n=1 Tax=Hippoglossus stenolepis TaxID=195615 RepID=UPI00148C029C|nr:interleukin-7 receptor subunit alpha isoform X2 [Hippoglossus hippoglossus]XP_035040835.1 interleukin-7 receptor subunit alpha [Hippoglossus stenolepis]
MASVWTIFLLLMVGVQAQSGDTDTDVDSGISCSSHITSDQTEGNSLTCELLPGRHDDEDDEDEGDSIETMTLCSSDVSDGWRRVKCVKAQGNQLNFTEAPIVEFNLTVQLKRGGEIRTRVDLKKIVKPRRPQVWNVTFNQELNQAVVHIQSPYHRDYLTGQQMFQLDIWATDRPNMIQNFSSESSMKIDMEHLRKNTEYHVKVRAIPVKFLEGSWSKWSDTFSFDTPAGARETDDTQQMYKVMLCLIPLAVVSVTVIFLRKNKILTYMWPSIPHPKDTLVHIGKPNKGLLLNFNPEVFSALRVSSMLQCCDEPESSLSPADGAQSTHPCSTQSSDCRSTTSVSTEELDLSALLSGSSSAADASLHSASPSPVHDLLLEGTEGCSGANETEALGAGQQEEAYVTMSSFYQVK